MLLSAEGWTNVQSSPQTNEDQMFWQLWGAPADKLRALLYSCKTFGLCCFGKVLCFWCCVGKNMKTFGTVLRCRYMFRKQICETIELSENDGVLRQNTTTSQKMALLRCKHCEINQRMWQCVRLSHSYITELSAKSTGLDMCQRHGALPKDPKT